MKQKTKHRTYKNAVAIALASFASIALISTGLAAFVIIRDQSQNVGGNISVGQVKDSSIALAVTSPTSGLNINLDAAPDDYVGRVQVGQGEDGALLSHTITGTVSVGEGKTLADNLELYFLVNIKNSESSVVNETFKTNYITKPRLAYKGFTDLAVAQSITATPVEASLTNATFSFDFGFEWGSNYGGLNPSIYYDTAGVGASTSMEEVVTELGQLYLINGYTFEITIHANNK